VLEASHLASAADLPGVIAKCVERLGVRQYVVYVADYEQRRLVPLVPDRRADTHEIDATMAGRAFRTIEIVEAPADGGMRLWIPLLDGADRVGVVEVVTDDISEGMRTALQHVASLTAELMVAKDQYSDVYAIARRHHPMSLAAEMQWELLPPVTFENLQIAISGVLEPTYHIAGDSFDYAVNGDTAHVAIVDAMGHGFAATMMATVAVNAYRHSRRHGRTLEETYRSIDDVIGERFGIDQFVTMQLVELDGSSGALRWLNAGHPAPLQVRNGKFVGPLTCAPTLPVGFGGAVAEVATESLEPGDKLLFFTDGVIEARSPSGEFFGEGRLADLLVRAITAEVPPAETVRRLSQAILAHQEGDLQDDATLLLLTWHGRQG
jgi:serine phosphatase RsbU (regulator of sigma subunit)